VVAVNRNGRTYYYKSIWRGGRVTSVYLGAGDVGLLRHALDLEDADGRRAADAAWAEGFRASGEVGADANAVCRAIWEAVRGALEAAGYHRPQRHGWARRRPTMKTLGDPGPRPPQENRERLMALHAKLDAGVGKAAVTAELRDLFRADNWAQRIGGPGEDLKLALAKLYAREPSMQAYFEVWLEATYKDVAGPNPTPLERLLAFRVALCWAVTHIYERLHAVQTGLRPSQMAAEQKRISSAHGRLMSSIRALADIRRLPLSATTVNIAAQLNVTDPARRLDVTAVALEQLQDGTNAPTD
jgi:hypothetical protein